MLVEDFYTVTGRFTDAPAEVFRVRLRPDSRVYEGHFPGHPISPGVCTMQLLRECAEEVAGRPLRMTEVLLARFLRLVTPETLPEADARILLRPDGTGWLLEAALLDGGVPCMTLKARLG